MKWRSLFFLFTCLLMQKLVSGQVPFEKKSGRLLFTCEKGSWEIEDHISLLNLSEKDDHYKNYNCLDGSDGYGLTVKIRTCVNCIELDKLALSAIIVGNLLATFLIAYAVYSITRQSKGTNFSANKASDKVNPIFNGEGDTYQRLNPGQTSEYSGLSGVRKK